uniref:Putative secreted protein n=1 Tax=Amblyomma cajennense TaxID=34607 RepID=A0A023FBM9_AMBCJ
MFVAAVICATLAVLITGDAHPQQLGDIQQTPPPDDDPECHREGDTSVLKKCTLKCQGDTLVALSGNESCYLSGAPIERSEAQTEEGICQNGDCVRKPEDSQA